MEIHAMNTKSIICKSAGYQYQEANKSKKRLHLIMFWSVQELQEGILTLEKPRMLPATTDLGAKRSTEFTETLHIVTGLIKTFNDEKYYS